MKVKVGFWNNKILRSDDYNTFLESAPCPANFLRSWSEISSILMIVYSHSCLGLKRLLNGVLKNVLAFISATNNYSKIINLWSILYKICIGHTYEFLTIIVSYIDRCLDQSNVVSMLLYKQHISVRFHQGYEQVWLVDTQHYLYIRVQPQRTMCTWNVILHY